MPKRPHARLAARFLAATMAALVLCAASASAHPSNHGHEGRFAAGVGSRQAMRASAYGTRFSIVTRSPANGQTISGTIPWQTTVYGGTPSRVDFAIDGIVKSSRTSTPFSYGGSAGLDTTKLSNGPHTLSVTAYGSRRTARSTITVTVSNPTQAPAAPAPTPEQAPSPEPAPAPAPAPAPTPAPAPAPAPTPTPPTSEPSPSPSPNPAPTPASSSVYWGAWIGEQLTGTQAPWDMNAVTKFEQMAGKKLSVVNFSAPFANCSGSSCSFYNFPSSEFNNIRSHGSIPFYSWGSQSIPVPSNLSEPNFQLSDVIAGTYDSYIRKFAEAAKAWGHPFFLRFNWEMNGGWFAWAEGVNGNKTGEYVTAWRHVHDIFTSVGATNATWVWCPNVDPENQMQSLSSLYPGNAYVDWTGLDGYNWGTNPTRPDRWRSFDQLYSSTYKKITETVAPSKPMMVSEVGSTEYGGSKASWIKDMLNTIPTNYPKIRGLLWFEKYDDGMDWPIETSSAATSAFATGIQSSAYADNRFGALASGPVLPAS